VTDAMHDPDSLFDDPETDPDDFYIWVRPRPSDRVKRPQTLEGRMQQVLVDMIVWISHGSTANWSATGAGGVASSKPPTGDSHPPQAYWLERWERAVKRDIEATRREGATIDRQRRAVLDAATEALDRWCKSPAPAKDVGETEAELAARVVRDGRGWSLEQVAMHCRCTVSFARKARLKAGANAETGVIAVPAPEPTDQRERAMELARNGMTERQIVMLTKLPKTTVRRALGRTA
jgi:hypothetical protein